MAECHPVGFQWVMEAKKRGAKVIHVDPRFTRTSAVADLHVPLRAGSDIAFLGGIVNYILSNDLYFDDYVRAYTNAATLLREDFRDTDDLDGLFSGYDPTTGTYDRTSWQYEGVEESPAAGERARDEHEGDRQDGDGRGGKKRRESEVSLTQRAAAYEVGGHGARLAHAGVQRDDTLQHPRCVFQVLKRHFARYTPERVEETCGVPVETFLDVCRAVTANSGRDRTTAWVYSVGWTHHTVGVQYIRTAAIIQLLLGNMGRPGGGIMALRGHASIQGSTDIPTLFHLLPGYLPMPKAGEHDTLDDYVASITSPSQKGFWAETRAYIVSLLKAYWGEAATAENDWCFDYLPRLTGDHGTYQTVMDMIADKVEGYMLLGQNPAVGSAHGKLQRLGMAHLKWLVVRDLNMIDSATFWKDGPEIETGELRTEDIATEVFFMPAAAHTEKDGTFTQTQRMLQWHHKAVDPPGDCRSELHFFFQLGRKLRERLANSTDERDRPLRDLAWDYPMTSWASRPPTRSWRKSTVSTSPARRRANRCRRSWRCAMTARRAADAGSTPVCTRTVSTSPSGGSLARSSRGSHPNGAGRGRRTGACCTTARRPTRRDDRGASARHTSGGMPMRASGPATTYRISSSTGRPDSGRRPTPPASPLSPVTIRSSCRPTGRVGCTCRPGYATVRCPRTTSRPNPRCAIRSTGSRRTQRDRCSRARTTTRTRRRRSRAATYTRSCSPRTG